MTDYPAGQYFRRSRRRPELHRCNCFSLAWAFSGDARPNYYDPATRVGLARARAGGVGGHILYSPGRLTCSFNSILELMHVFRLKPVKYFSTAFMQAIGLARQLVTQPGVHVATSTSEVMKLVESIVVSDAEMDEMLAFARR